MLRLCTQGDLIFTVRASGTFCVGTFKVCIKSLMQNGSFLNLKHSMKNHNYSNFGRDEINVNTYKIVA